MRAVAARLRGQREEEVREGNPPFFEALENQEISGLDTYNIKTNARRLPREPRDESEEGEGGGLR